MHALARRLHDALADERIARSDFRVPGLATADLSGDVVAEVTARGKNLLMRTRAGLTIHSHLKMDGRWRLVQPGARLPGPAHEIRVVLGTGSRTAVGLRLGLVALWRTERERQVLGHLGPDVLGRDWDPAEALRRLAEDPARPIGDALLDQRALAGIGNVYKCELCFLRGIDPWTPVGDVRDLPAMLALAKRLMEANRARGGQVTTGDLSPGRRRWVYGRRGEPCMRCGTAIRRRAEEGERVTYWCPSCQPARGAERAS